MRDDTDELTETKRLIVKYLDMTRDDGMGLEVYRRLFD